MLSLIWALKPYFLHTLVHICTVMLRCYIKGLNLYFPTFGNYCLKVINNKLYQIMWRVIMALLLKKKKVQVIYYKHIARFIFLAWNLSLPLNQSMHCFQRCMRIQKWQILQIIILHLQNLNFEELIQFSTIGLFFASS